MGEAPAPDPVIAIWELSVFDGLPEAAEECGHVAGLADLNEAVLCAMEDVRLDIV